MNEPFKKLMTIEQASQNIFNLMRRDFDSDWLNRLSSVPGLDIVRAEDEMVFLDLFSVYFSIKCNMITQWHDRGELIYENIKSLFLDWLEKAWREKKAGSRDDAERILDSRFKSYMACIDGTKPTDYEKLRRSIGEIFAIYAFADESSMGPDGKPLESRFFDLYIKINRDVEKTTTGVGTEVFWHRVVVMLNIFRTYEIA